jgi:hypothetical protein
MVFPIPYSLFPIPYSLLAALSMRLSKLSRDATVKRSIVALVLRLERQRRELQRVENVAQVELRQRAD